MDFIKIKTPCIGVCSTGIGDDVCRGCKRFKHEVIDWNRYDIDKKIAIDKRLASLLSSLVASRFLITDEQRLRYQLQVQPVEVPEHRDIYCQLFVLVKTGASQINAEDFGFLILPEYESSSLVQLVKDIDDAFYQLSVAHYERYFVQPLKFAK